jgi:hypothetical protein
VRARTVLALCAMSACSYGPLVVFAVPAAHADGSGGSGSQAAALSGYTAGVQALAVQVAFNIPGIVPLPDSNLFEADAPFARTSVSNGPVITAQGAPYYPGDVAANLGSLISEFAPPGAPSFPNDPLQAEAQYPPTPGHGEDATFGPSQSTGQLAPSVASATAHADQNGASVTASMSGLDVGAPSTTSSAVIRTGPTGAAASEAPAVEVGAVKSTNLVSVASGAVEASASTVLNAVTVAGILRISQITSGASSHSDGNQADPSASLHLADVSVEGQPAYVDAQGVHVTGKTVAPGGVTPQAAQRSLDDTLAQDGITVRVVDPQTQTNGAQGTSDSGGLVVSIDHKFSVPYIQGEPTLPVPGLGNVGLPAGDYTATTTVTLGAATSQVAAAVSPSLSGLGPQSPPGGPLSAGALSDATQGLYGSSGPPLGVSGGSPTASALKGGSESLGANASSRLPLGVPVAVGWVLLGLVLCVIFSYPMLLAVRWQFLSGRGR